VKAWTCPLELWWDVCLLGGCDELFGILTNVVNPDPTQAILRFDRVEIANDVLYVTPPAGIDVRGVAEALAGGELAGLAANGPETGTLRIELWRKGTTDVTGAEIPPRFVALVSEYDPALVGTGELEVGGWVAIQPLVEERSLHVASTWVPGAGADTEMPDRDGDRVPDPFDGCLDVADPEQVDTNGDGFNNRCDADYDEDGRVGIGDFNRLRGGFGKTCSERGYAADLDMNDDCAIGLGEFNLLRSGFGGAPGPSGRACTPDACAR
jgi:hypothetical protein